MKTYLEKHPQQPPFFGERGTALETIGSITQDAQDGSLAKLESECVEVSPILEQCERRGRLWSGSSRERRTTSVTQKQGLGGPDKHSN